ncbi:hypothetical protein EYM_03115 [Ignicoccus islandicus DSM 13165]|uniref:VIT family protein n=1 Tax=Ignicoccus islandicus DSM 13165 TaxID=940295 RepID=A0A0U2U638_9CREN|nr:hypothetical protein [Ignicoccus islandicus]ALU11620.1 hypothetical protein EYM_03115 [Ignicoccus islandicus DSM 13165]
MNERAKEVIESLGVKEIARRMLATNGVDSLLSTIGILNGTLSATHSNDPNIYLSSVLGGAVSLGLLSGFVGVYITERAERLEELRKIERAMARKLNKSFYAKAVNYASVYVALWSLVGSLVLPLTSLIPIILSKFGVLETTLGVLLSIVLAHLELSLIGLSFGGSNRVKVAIQYLILGIGATIISMLLGNVIS